MVTLAHFMLAFLVVMAAFALVAAVATFDRARFLVAFANGECDDIPPHVDTDWLVVVLIGAFLAAPVAWLFGVAHARMVLDWQSVETASMAPVALASILRAAHIRRAIADGYGDLNNPTIPMFASLCIKTPLRTLEAGIDKATALHCPVQAWDTVRRYTGKPGAHMLAQMADKGVQCVTGPWRKANEADTYRGALLALSKAPGLGSAKSSFALSMSRWHQVNPATPAHCIDSHWLNHLNIGNPPRSAKAYEAAVSALPFNVDTGWAAWCEYLSINGVASYRALSPIGILNLHRTIIFKLDRLTFTHGYPRF